VATVPVLQETTDPLLSMSRLKLQEKDFSALRLPATLSLHVKRSPQQVIDFSYFLALRLSAIVGSIR
jgi:hypothetical protein